VTCRLGSTSLEIGAGGSNGTSLFLDIASPLPVGTYTFDVIAADAAISQTLQGRFQVGDFAIQFDSAGSPALPSGQQIFQVDLTSINNFQGGVGLTCSGLPAGASCTGGGTFFGISTSVVTGIGVTTVNVPVGNYPFVINGDTGFTTHSVNAVLHVGDFGATTFAPSTATLSVGQSATFNVTIASVNGFNDTVTLLCIPTVNGHGTNGVGCNISPSPGTFDSAGNLHAQMKVTINAAPQPSKLLAQSFQARWGVLLSTVIIVGLISAAMPRRRRKMVAVCGVCLLGIASVISCGGGGGAGGGGNGGPTPTPTPTPVPQPVVVKVDILGSSTTQNLSTQKSVASINITVQ
jgi:hypothetical protein